MENKLATILIISIILNVFMLNVIYKNDKKNEYVSKYLLSKTTEELYFELKDLTFENSSITRNYLHKFYMTSLTSNAFLKKAHHINKEMDFDIADFRSYIAMYSKSELSDVEDENHLERISEIFKLIELSYHEVENSKDDIELDYDISILRNNYIAIKDLSNKGIEELGRDENN